MSTSLNQDVLERVRAEYLEMPGLRLTVEQVQRLCGIERAMCRVVLETLVEAKFLCTKSNGAYARVTDGDISRPRPAKTDLERKTVMQLSRLSRG
jgi:response regulator of citrate/malate metabolism